jgi:hypothetical protein
MRAILGGTVGFDEPSLLISAVGMGFEVWVIVLRK